MIGKIISHYKILEKLGEGGMGVVYKAQDTKLDRIVALKFLPKHLLCDSEAKIRFEHEAKAASALNHTSITTIHEIDEIEGECFIAMECVEGKSLKKLLEKKAFSIKEVVDIAIQVCEGLAIAHEKGIVHRDIKSDNIMLTPRGQVKIMDFGLAKLRGATKLTKTGSTLGTMPYMSPEQVQGIEVDRRSDIFSLGVVLYELITGQLPFKDEHEAAIIYSILNETPEPLARYKSGVSVELQSIISKALAKDQGLRYQHADELAADLKRFTSASGPVPATRRRGVRVLLPLLAVLVLISAALTLKPWRIVIKPSADMATGLKRVVVVPFRNQTGDPSLDPLGRMIADWTTQGLLESGLAEVVPPERLSQFEKSMSIRSITRSTRAKTIVIGSYYKFGDTIQFQAQILDANEMLLQAIDPIRSQVANAMDGVESVRQHVLGALAFVFDKRLQKPIMHVSKPPKYEAYQEYIQGLDLFIKEDYSVALEHLNRAYALDTSFMLPLIVACAAYVNLTQWPQADSLTKLLDHRRAQLNQIQQLALDELQGIISGDWLKAFNASREEVKLAPESKSNYASWALAALVLNRPRECIEALSTISAQDTSMRQWSFYWDLLTYAHHILGQHKVELGVARECQKENPASYIALKCEIRALIGLGRVEEVKKLVEEGFAFPNQPEIPEGPMVIAAVELRAHGYENEAMKMLDQLIQRYKGKSDEEKKSDLWHYSFALYQARRWTEAKEIFEELVKLRPDIIEFQYYLGRIAARLGNREDAMKISDSLKNLQRPYLFGGNTYCRAGIAAILGEKEQAISLLKESFLQGHDYNLHTDFDFESLKDYPSFKELLKPKG